MKFSNPAVSLSARRLAIVLVLLITGVLSTLPASPSHALQTSNLQIQIQPGFQGYFRPGQPLAVRLAIHNTGAPITGSVRVAAQPVTVNSNTFSAPVDLPTGADKQITVIVVFTASIQHAQVDLLDANGAIVGTASAAVNAIDPGDALYGVVSSAPNNTIDLSAAHQERAKAYPILLPIDALPDSALALGALNSLIFASTDTGRLTTAQRSAITGWIASGGRLIVVGGPDWQLTATGLDTVLPLHPTGSATLDNLNALANFGSATRLPADYQSPTLSGATVVAQGTLDPAARVLITQGNTPLVTERALGNGVVDYLAFDPNLAPFRAWADRAQFWTQLLIVSTAPRPGWANGVVRAPVAAEAAGLVIGLQLPQVIVVGGFLLIYILLIGPANYLILRAIRRLEWAWFTIPALIIIATVGAYQIGLSLRGTQPILTRLSVVQSWAGQSQARIDGIIGLTAPQQARYDLTVDAALVQPITSTALVSLLDPAGGFATRQTVDASGSHLSADQLALASEVNRAFIVVGSVPTPTLTGSAIVTVNTDGSLTLAGQVTNDSAVPLEKATLIMLDIAFPLGTIAGGQNVPFSFHVNAPLHAVPIGGGSEQAATGQVTAPANPGKSTATSTLDLLRSTIPSEVAVSGADVINLTDRRVQARRVDLLNAFIRPDELGGGRGLQVYLVGWQASASFPAALNTPDSRAESDTLNIVALAMQFNTRVPVIALTPGYFTWQPIAADTTSSIPGAANNSNASALVTDDPYNLYVPSNGKTAFEFAPRSGVHVTQITNLTLLGQVVQTDAGALSLWDWANNRWVLVVQPGTQLSAPQGYATNDPADLARFVGNGGRVRVLIESVNGIADYSRLDITLGAELAMPISAS